MSGSVFFFVFLTVSSLDYRCSGVGRDKHLSALTHEELKGAALRT